MSNWTADDIPPLGGNRAVVTGANSGLGAIVARELAKAGASVVLACRDVEKGERAADDIRSAVGGADIVVRRLDLADLSSVRQFARQISDEGPLNLLVNNAGVMALPRRQTADGFELQFGTNHLGHFALTGLLLDTLLAAKGPRVVTVSSGAHHFARPLNFDDLQSSHRYERWMVYARSKLANLLFAFELDRRARAADLPLTSVAAHPGYATTNLQHAGPRMEGGLRGRLSGAVMTLSNRVIGQSDEMGALPLLYAATVPDVEGGTYFGPSGLRELRGYPQPVAPGKRARDREAARRLWEESERLTGVTFTQLN